MFGGAPIGATLIGLRPEHIELGGGQDCEVTRIEHLGDQTRLYLRLGDHHLITLTDSHTPMKVGLLSALRQKIQFSSIPMGLELSKEIL
jgi:multiple sugar transport system ATP-binding protein